LNIASHPSFIKRDEKAIPSLNLTIESFEHEKTGAQHFHLHADNNENVFLVGLKTIPTDSKGVAHILEHTALCGSKKYPVRDPFFMMIRRSLNTFMNAFTSSDWTAYPFASQNKKDFSNLLDVYLDAVFFSNLDKLDFAQEGHRLEFAEMENSESDLTFKGVVFNEMKGAMSSPISVLWQTLTQYVFPTTTYHYNSGGEPVDIPDLSYEELTEFYKTHYHPSNAVFFTYGDIPAIEHQTRFHDQVLQHFSSSDKKIVVPKEQRYNEPQYFTESYALDEDSSAENKTHVVTGWLLGESVDLETCLKATLLSSVLLDNGSSPLRYALENTKLGSAPSPLCGLEDSNREMIFMCGLEGAHNDSTQEIESMILNVLNEVAEKGVEQSRLEAALHQLELAQKEITGGSYPYGLQLILDMLPVSIHQGDTINSLDIGDILEKLREEVKAPGFFSSLVKTLLIDNKHRVCLTLKPDQTLNEAKEAEEKKRLEAIKTKLSDEQKQAIVAQSLALKTRQEQLDDESILPKVGVEDVPDEMHIAEGKTRSVGGMKVDIFEQGTNGIVYEQLVVELPELDEKQLEILPIYTRLLTELGSNDRTYLETQSLMDEVTGGISAYSSTRSDIDDIQKSKAFMVVSGKALVRNQSELGDLLQETLLKVSFEEKSRIREIVAQQRAAKENSITGNGHGLAMMAASSGMSPVANLKHQTVGLEGIKKLKALDDAINDEEKLDELVESFKAMHAKIIQSPIKSLLIGEKSSIGPMFEYRMFKWISFDNKAEPVQKFSLPKINEDRSQFWVTNTQVNFCSKSFQAVEVNHEDAASLMVLGGFLKNGFLHRVIREQGGAYGGGAGYDSDAAAFRFYSYRDPRLVETLADYDKSIDWMLTEDHDPQKLEEAILGVIGAFDKPSSPSGEAKNAFHNRLFDRTPEQRQAFRKKVLEVTLDDLKRVTEKYLKTDKHSVAVLSNQATLDSVGDLGLEVHHL